MKYCKICGIDMTGMLGDTCGKNWCFDEWCKIEHKRRREEESRYSIEDHWDDEYSRMKDEREINAPE